MKKIIAIVAFLLVLSISVLYIIGREKETSHKQSKIQIVTTLFPLYDMAKTIGGDKVEVSLLLPPGVEAHSFEPKPGDVAQINEADIFIYTGKFMEPWAEDVIKGVSNKNLKVVDASRNIVLREESEHDHEENEQHESEKEHHHDGIDPHIWLDFDNDKTMVQTITKALAEKDSVNLNYYQQKSEDYQDKLSSLDLEYKESLTKCATNEIVYSGHYAFGYLASRYGLRYLAAQGVSPDAEPTAQNLIKLVDQIRKNNIQYIFYEELTTPKIAETLAKETKTKILLLNAAHNITREDFENDVSFLTIMQENLGNLKIGLRCFN